MEDQVVRKPTQMAWTRFFGCVWKTRLIITIDKTVSYWYAVYTFILLSTMWSYCPTTRTHARNINIFFQIAI